jgi:FlaA1/EpsC-like NDP-sugar epimerase
LGSSGSVIPRFARQIAEGGPVTVTHPDITRFFMTIPEACSLVLEAGNLGKGGEVFIFDMGQSVKIKDLAEEMVRLSGLEPYKDIDIKFTGLRPGEKLFEELLYDKETMDTLKNKKIMIANVRVFDFQQVSMWMDKLIQTADSYDKKEIVKVMKEIVPEFVSKNSEYEFLDKSLPSETCQITA